MSILFDGRRWVNPAPFADGITPPDPSPVSGTAPAGSSITPADRARLDAAADAATGGDVECDPSEWPAWTDYHQFVPTPSERSWWAAESERIAAERADRDADARAAESAALDAMERGLIPPDLAAEIARTSLVGHPE